MSRTARLALAATLALAVAAPAAADAATPTAHLTGRAPQIHLDGHGHANIVFSATALPKRPSGAPEATITIVGHRAWKLRAITSGSRPTYVARLSNARAFHLHTTERVTFRLGSSPSVVRTAHVM